jgi:hypothetical protein
MSAASHGASERDVKVVEQQMRIRAWLSEETYEQLGGDDLEDPRVGQLRDDIQAQVRRAMEALQAQLRRQFPDVTFGVEEHD